MIEDMAVKIKDMLTYLTQTHTVGDRQHIQKGELLVISVS